MQHIRSGAREGKAVTSRHRLNTAENGPLRRKSLWLALGCLLTIIAIACNCNLAIPGSLKSTSGNPAAGAAEQPPVAAPIVPVQPSIPAPKGPAFTDADCAVSGVSFPPPSVGYEVSEIHDGPYLYCSSSQEGAHGLSDTAYIGITTFQSDKLDGAYRQSLDGIQGFVAQAEERNAIPDLPAEARDEITFLRQDEDGYVFMITSQADVQECLYGAGHGAEKVNGKYLVITHYESCELGDGGAYTAALENLRVAALAAIQRVEAASQ